MSFTVVANSRRNLLEYWHSNKHDVRPRITATRLYKELR
ncbi:hypothetical protein [Salmonella phage SD-1_S14]|nr:hypothetical protein [Salmonella phage SD-2_S15]WPK18892.1 hypothetical protein [Salmonella phage SD-6_S16]WPK19559.1 hypothetical protein [Salmonella phage SD-1_S14]WPK20587.1 hypothetical protein [Salmonella phage SD-15_S21]